MRAPITILFSLCAFAAAAADTYRWQDGDGHIHYGDEPPEGAKQLRKIKTYDCETAQCKADLQQRYDEAVAANQALDEWLRQRDAARSARQAAFTRDRSSPVYIGTSVVFTGPPVVTTILGDPFYGPPRKHTRPRHYGEPSRRLRSRYQLRP